jgi:uridine phosphorylase
MWQTKVEPNNGEEQNFEDPVRNSDGSIKLRNPHIQHMPVDYLYHLNIDPASQNLLELFGDVKFVCMGGTQHRMKSFAKSFKSLLKIDIISYNSTRCSIDKVGPVLFISHGMGAPSMSIFLHEIIKLIYYAKIKDPVLFKIGFCGGFGLDCGTVVITKDVVDENMKDYYKVSTLGNVREVKRPAKLDHLLVGELYALADLQDPYLTTYGKTMCTSDFYEEQGRLDGAFCEYTAQDRADYLATLQKQAVFNIEMQAIPFAAITHYAGIKAAIVCVVVSDKLKSDQVGSSQELNEWEKRPKKLVAQYIKRYFENEQKKRTMLSR